MEKINRFLIFAGYFYYPNGGMDDYIKTVTTFEEVQEFIDSLKGYDWVNVLDIEAGEAWETFSGKNGMRKLKKRDTLGYSYR